MRATASATRSGSSAAGGTGLRVSTRQKPQARVHRSPRIMNVAVPSAQHSLRLGQPASSHTVTRPRSRTVRFSVSTPAPVLHLGPQPLGLAGRDREALGDTGLGQPAEQAHRGAGGVRRRVAHGSPGPSPRENGDRSSGVCRQATSAARLRRRPTARRRAGRRRRPPRAVGVDALLGQRGDRPVGDAARHDVARAGSACRSSTLRAKPCIVRSRLSRTPMAQILRGSVAVGVDPHARVLAQPAGTRSGRARPARRSRAARRRARRPTVSAHARPGRRAWAAGSGSGSRPAGPGPW